MSGAEAIGIKYGNVKAPNAKGNVYNNRNVAVEKKQPSDNVNILGGTTLQKAD